MENRKIFPKWKLLIALLAVLLAIAVVVLWSPQLTLQAHASILDEFIIQDESQLYGLEQPLVDIVKEDGNLGWDPLIYEAEQVEHQVLANASLNSAQTYSTTTSTLKQ